MVHAVSWSKYSRDGLETVKDPHLYCLFHCLDVQTGESWIERLPVEPKRGVEWLMEKCWEVIAEAKKDRMSVVFQNRENPQIGKEYILSHIEIWRDKSLLGTLDTK